MVSRSEAMSIELPDSRSEPDVVLEALRMRALHARQLGYAAVDVAAILGVCEETVSRWSAKYEQGGQEALPGKRTGRPVGSGRLLSEQEEDRVIELIDSKLPQDLGIASALWTRAAVRDLIEQITGQRLPIRTVGEYLNRWGYTPQKPVRKAYKQDPAEVAEWLEKTYPDIEKRAAEEGAEIHWGDECGVRSTCQHGRGYARPQDTPELKVPGSRFSVNMISALTNLGKIQWMIYSGRMNAALFIVFLTQLITGATKKVFLIVDHLSVHEAAAVHEWLKDKKDKIEVFFLPKYSPERNPDEYFNCDLKGNINTDGLPKDRQELTSKLERFMDKLSKLPARIASYFRHKFIQYAAAPLPSSS
jgi:transposase